MSTRPKWGDDMDDPLYWIPMATLSIAFICLVMLCMMGLPFHLLAMWLETSGR
jgi:hypothetical protein